MIFSNGIVAAISSIIRKLTNVGDSILIQSPVYNCFFSSIKDNNRTVLTNELIYENGAYHIDYDDLEEKLSREEVKLFILCNPHNPIGMMWSKDDLIKMTINFPAIIGYSISNMKEKVEFFFHD